MKKLISLHFWIISVFLFLFVLAAYLTYKFETYENFSNVCVLDYDKAKEREALVAVYKNKNDSNRIFLSRAFQQEGWYRSFTKTYMAQFVQPPAGQEPLSLDASDLHLSSYNDESLNGFSFTDSIPVAIEVNDTNKHCLDTYFLDTIYTANVKADNQRFYIEGIQAIINFSD